MTQRHKHADLIIAWANGAKIQVKVNNGGKVWKDCDVFGPPGWYEGNEYRIKPEPKPDVVLYAHIQCRSNLNTAVIAGGLASPSLCEGEDNVKLVFDGETNTLKSVEMIK